MTMVFSIHIVQLKITINKVKLYFFLFYIWFVQFVFNIKKTGSIYLCSTPNIQATQWVLISSFACGRNPCIQLKYFDLQCQRLCLADQPSQIKLQAQRNIVYQFWIGIKSQIMSMTSVLIDCKNSCLISGFSFLHFYLNRFNKSLERVL